MASKRPYLSKYWPIVTINIHYKGLLVADRITKSPTQKLFKCKGCSTKTPGQFCAERNKTKCVRSWPVEQLWSSFFASQKLASSSFYRAPSDGVSSFRRNKAAQPWAAWSTKDADRSPPCWLSWLQTGYNFRISDLNVFSKTKHLRLD